MGPYDVLIAGQAQARSMILVTGNADELKRVEGLTIENWGGTAGKWGKPKQIRRQMIALLL